MGVHLVVPTATNFPDGFASLRLGRFANMVAPSTNPASGVYLYAEAGPEGAQHGGVGHNDRPP
jgi:hypothetical protein